MALQLKRKPKEAAAGPDVVPGTDIPSAPTVSAGYKIPAGKPRKGRSYGVDIDGNVVRVVELLDNDVVSYGTYQGVTTDDAFRRFLSTRPSGDVNVAWMGGNMHILRAPVPELPDAALRLGILDSIDEQLPITPGSASIAARLFVAPNGTTTAAIAAVERDSTAGLWDIIGQADVGVIPSPLLLVQDGLYLGVRYSEAHVMLVNGGAVVSARPLASGGLTSMFEKLGGDPARAAERFATVARGGTRLDPEAAAVVDQYSAAIGEEVRRTVDFWARQGNNVPSEVFVHGPGIVLPNLSGKLLDAALFARPVALPDVSMDTIARTERPTAYLALLAAQMDLGVQPIADLIDPRHADRARKNKEKAKKTARLFMGLGLAGLAVVAFLVPYGIAKTRNVLAVNSRRAAENAAKGYAKELKLKAEVEAGVKVYNAAVAGEIAWETLYKSIIESAPPGLNPQFQSLSISPSGSSVVVTFTAVMKNPSKSAEDRGGFDRAIASWVDELRKRGSSEPWPSSFSAASDVGTAVDGTVGAIITGSFNAPIPLDPKNPVTRKYLSLREITIPGVTTTVPQGEVGSTSTTVATADTTVTSGVSTSTTTVKA